MSNDSGPKQAEIDAGRRLFVRPWRFLSSAPSITALPPPLGIEVAFAGRSNVGKSSLINALVGQKALARTSNTPGRTQELVFFRADAGITLVDMPGYGYARAPKTQVAAWTKLAFDYLRGRNNLRRLYLLVDARHGIKESDDAALSQLDAAAVSTQVVLTKADKLKAADLEAVTAATRVGIARHPTAHPDMIVTSAFSGLGLDQVRAAIAGLLPSSADL